MDRFFCAAALCALLVLAAARMDKPAAQEAFFSMLFPQLIPGYALTEETATPDEAAYGEAVLL